MRKMITTALAAVMLVACGSTEPLPNSSFVLTQVGDALLPAPFASGSLSVVVGGDLDLGSALAKQGTATTRVFFRNPGRAAIDSVVTRGQFIRNGSELRLLSPTGRLLVSYSVQNGGTTLVETVRTCDDTASCASTLPLTFRSDVVVPVSAR